MTDNNELDTKVDAAQNFLKKIAEHPKQKNKINLGQGGRI